MESRPTDQIGTYMEGCPQIETSAVIVVGPGQIIRCLQAAGYREDAEGLQLGFRITDAVGMGEGVLSRLADHQRHLPAGGTGIHRQFRGPYCVGIQTGVGTVQPGTTSGRGRDRGSVKNIQAALVIVETVNPALIESAGVG